MQEALVTVSNLRRKPWGHRSWEGSLVILQSSLLLKEPPGVSWIMWLRGFASQVLKTSSNEVLSSGWVTYPSALALRLKNFFPNRQLEFSLCSLWWRLLSFHWAWWFYHHAVICWLLGSPRTGIGKNGFWSAVTSIVTSCHSFPTGLLSIFSLCHWMKWFRDLKRPYSLYFSTEAQQAKCKCGSVLFAEGWHVTVRTPCDQSTYQNNELRTQVEW